MYSILEEVIAVVQQFKSNETGTYIYKNTGAFLTRHNGKLNLHETQESFTYCCTGHMHISSLPKLLFL